jgi:L,D-transpeptidase catalytic domain
MVSRARAATAVAVATALAIAAPESASAHTSLRPTATRAYIARIVAPTVARSEPGGGRVRWRVPDQTEWADEPVRLLVLRSATTRRGRQWLDVRLPIRPNTASGWIDADYAELSTTPWRVVVHTVARTVSVYKAGRMLRRFPAVVGKPSTPTPHGLFAIYEKVHEPDPTGFLGPWALHLTAHSNVLLNFGGGPGRVAMHGRDGASLLDPLGTADSHGCIRLLSANIIWMAGVLSQGDPTQVMS